MPVAKGAVASRCNAWFDLAQPAWLRRQGLRLDGVLIHHLEPETARNDSLLRFANRLPSTLISAETPRRRFSGCPPDGCIASYRVHWPGLVLEPALALVDCAFQADASTDGSADGCLHRRECLPGAERTSQACRWAADQLPLMLEQQRRTAAAKGGNGWNYNEVVVDGPSFEEALPRSITAFFVTPQMQQRAGGGSVREIGVRYGQLAPPLICYDPSRKTAPFSLVNEQGHCSAVR